MKWLNANIMVIDLETTGFHNEDQIIQIGIVHAIKRVVIARNEVLVNPLRENSPGAFAVNGITDESLEVAAPIDAVVPGLNRAFRGIDGIVCHNIGFDLRFIRKLKGIKINRKIPCYCTQTRARQLGYKGKLADIAQAAGIKVDRESLHGALYDAQITYQLFGRITPEHFTIKNCFHDYL